jgi:hypothetical protein
MMRDHRIFVLLCMVLIALLIASVARNYIQGQSLLGVNEFILIGFLIFLVIGDELVRVTRSGVDVQSKDGAGVVGPPKNKHDQT